MIENNDEVKNEYNRNTIINYPSLDEILICLMIVVANFVFGLALNLYDLTSWEFWVKLIILLSLVLFIFKLIQSLKFKRLFREKTFLELESEYYRLLNKRKQDFSCFLEVYNRCNKKKAFVIKVQREIFRLEHKLYFCHKKSKKIMLQNKINSLNIKIEEKYLDDNIDLIKIKYLFFLNDDFPSAPLPQFITSGYEAYHKAIKFASFKKCFTFILVTICPFTIAISKSLSIKLVIYTVLSSINIFALVFYFAYIDAYKFFELKYIKHYKDKLEVLAQYEEWKKIEV